MMQPRLTYTDGDGSFEIRDLDALPYTVGASAPTYVAAPREPESGPTIHRIGDSITVNLVKGGVITGRVTSASGEPLVGAIVRAFLRRDASGKAPASFRFPMERPTDDRGIYRIYGLAPGSYQISAGGRGGYGYSTNAYDTDAPTYAPSSTRETAAEIIVRAGEETSGVDVRYRGEPGHAVSGVVSGSTVANSSTNISLAQIIDGLPQPSAVTYQENAGKSFSLYGVADGEYDLIAQTYAALGQVLASEPRRIVVKGADVSGLELVVKALGSVSGQVVLEPSTASECLNKRQPLLAETLLVMRRSDKLTPKDQLAFPNYFAQVSPGKTGSFQMHNLAPGQFNLTVKFFAKYWYLRGIARENLAPITAKGRALSLRQTDAARNGINLKFGEQVSGLRITLAAGAASLRGKVKLADGESMPQKLYVYLGPAEQETADDVLRFFMVAVAADGSFALNNVPPGRYWSVARVAGDDEPQSTATLRSPEQAELRAQMRRAGESAKTAVEFKPCQNVQDYQLPLKNGLPKN
jgi:hypothetical protein